MPSPAEARRNDDLELDEDADFGAHALAAGWTDGLPVVAPTPERVERMIAAADADPLRVLGVLAPGQGIATVHAVAVNAVMAGCRDEHLPVVIAAMEAVLTPVFNIKGVQATTSPVTPAILVSGPVVERLGFNGGHNCLGPGNQSNAVVGRALRFCLLNIGGAHPGAGDMSTQGQPGKYTFCFAENRAAAPWPPLQVERGFAEDRSCVTVFQAGMVTNVLDFGSRTAEDLIGHIAATLRSPNSNNMQLGCGDLLVVVCPQHAAIFAREGLDRAAVRERLHALARMPAGGLTSGVFGCVRDWRRTHHPDLAPDEVLPVVEDARDIHLVVAGGSVGGQTAIVPGFDGASVTVPISPDDTTHGGSP